MDSIEKAKLNVFEHIETMNECCHHKGKTDVVPWSFGTRLTKKFCYQTKESVPDQYRHEPAIYTVDRICPSCAYLLKKLSELNQKLRDEQTTKAE